ncbi:transposase [Burkholderia sp. SCN-KJ]|nr:transposase [Burkholderia sp. SCN-KJ]MCR4470425.1 transposase [Burkholderia sp. SCN-KJ]
MWQAHTWANRCTWLWDNLNTHRARAVWQAFNKQHGKRFRFHFTRLHASWVNQIELWFARYTRRVLRYASHTGTAHVRERTEQFVDEQNQATRPFKWSFRRYPLQGGASSSRGRRVSFTCQTLRCCTAAATAQSARP